MKRFAVLLFSALVACTLATVGILSDPSTAEAAGNRVKKCGGGKISLNADEKKAFALHNAERRDRNLRPLCVSPKLQKVARAHSKDMIRRDYFSHTTKGTKRDGCDRVENSGYRFRACGENIAWGSGAKGSPESIMRSWMKSSGHRSNILSRKYREVGIGTYTGTFNGYRNVTMYTADFATRR